MPSGRFELICEVEPAARPDLAAVRQQVGVMTPVASAFLIPDNHLGRASVSSIAVAHEVAAMGSEAIACVNSRDRNRLGFRRDLLTAAAYGPRTGRRPEWDAAKGTVGTALAAARGSSSGCPQPELPGHER